MYTVDDYVYDLPGDPNTHGLKFTDGIVSYMLVFDGGINNNGIYLLKDGVRWHIDDVRIIWDDDDHRVLELRITNDLTKLINLNFGNLFRGVFQRLKRIQGYNEEKRGVNLRF